MMPLEVIAYLRTMAKRDRLITLVSQGDLVAGFATYFLLRDEWECDSFFQREPRWSTPEDAMEGSLVYLDYLECWAWHRGWLRSLEHYLVTRHPQVTTAVWHRPRHHAGQQVIYHRRDWDVADISS